MKLTCPHCDYSRQIDPQKIPPGTVRVKCPLCTEAFDLPQQQYQQEQNETVGTSESPQLLDPSQEHPQEPQQSAERTPADASQQTVGSADTSFRLKCNRCGTIQQSGHQCINCGSTFIATTSAPFVFATFWMRAVATLVDAAIVFGLQMILGGLLALAGTVTVVGSDGGGETAFIVYFFSYLISFTYYIFFTGYCGQTPGKMVLRIKVVRQDGSPISYGRAAFREVPAKFLSGVIFGIGYLMVLFDKQKRALHDRMSDTYVIKL